MANKKAGIKSKRRNLYLQEEAFNEFSKIAKKHGKSPSEIFNQYMLKVIDKAKSNRPELSNV